MRKQKIFRSISWISLCLLFVGCTAIARYQLSELYGPEKVQQRVRPATELAENTVDFWRDVKPIFDNRCVVCHSCYDSPCQLKLSSAEGVDRGASKAKVYDGTRLFPADPSRLYIDAQNTTDWRDKGFSPVLNERNQNSEANLRASVLYRLLDLKRKNPLPNTPVLPAESFDFSLDRNQQCPSAEELDSFEKNFPLWGMPYGCPAISEKEFATIETWLTEGALIPKAPALNEKTQLKILQWEEFLNGNSLKEQLMSRYIYEHLFLADLFFDDETPIQHFRLVRSSTPPGTEIAVIPTRRPTDDPGVSRVYYRLMLSKETLVAKTFMPYALSQKRMQRYNELFLKTPFKVEKLPSYEPQVSSNPFKAFRDIPSASKYRFMLDDTQFFIMGFIKGPVCRGQVALNVIDDQFWVFFVDPNKDPIAQDPEFLSKESNLLSLPAEDGSATTAVFSWHRYAKEEKRFLKAKRNYLIQHAAGRSGPQIKDLWNGNKTNTDAALTVFRHYDSASVVRGLVGNPPKTAWIIGYPLLERLHYLLVVGFDVFGNVGHQLLTRLYMDFLRVEAENNFLLLLPKNKRVAEHDFWYRGIGADNSEYILSPKNYNWIESGVHYSSNNPKLEFFDKMRKYLGKALDSTHNLGKETPAALLKISQLKGSGLSVLPEISIIRLKRKAAADEVYTLLLNRALSNTAVLYLEDMRLLPEENTITLAKGFVGAYPNSLLLVEEGQLDSFANELALMKSEEDYKRFLDTYGIRRTNPQFWQYSDWLQSAYRRLMGENSGILDYSRLENR